MLFNLGVLAGCLIPGIYTAYTDIKRGVIYDAITLLIFLAGFVFALISGHYINSFIGCTVGFLSTFIAAWITNGAVGGGDIKLAAGLGMWFGYPHTIIVLTVACLAGIFFELFRYWQSESLRVLFYERLGPYARKVVMRFGYRVKSVDLSVDDKYTPLPFAPFLVASSWLVWILSLKGGI